MCRWGHGDVAPPIFSNLQESWSKVSQAAKRVDHSIFCDFFSNDLVTILGQLVRTPHPQQKASPHITGGDARMGSYLGPIRFCLPKGFPFSIKTTPHGSPSSELQPLE